MIRFWNPGAVRNFGFTKDQALGRSLDIIILEKLQVRQREGWNRVLQTGQSRYVADELLAVPAMTSDGRLCEYTAAAADHLNVHEVHACHMLPHEKRLRPVR
ncbi:MULTISPECIES: PAS domain-containing protein [Acetobacteraceae]|uniref:PAS domain-containing protein n=3 Tax=Acetobacteraceae TaxID=433 RepID=A0AB35AR27_GLUOY|nr:PAS domain-containing protein [Gluconobacter oxydans]NHN86876.1 PAS domain-containing protein [Acetobacter musti]NHO34341.1 PAS domain-containing protein [Acetobacter fallax]NHO37912.1 PAS domain-containing protein [Acetobacter fallax]NHO58209.1 PAS domain-containing protein [Acetobacter lambici]